jgi:hypothetical protein
MSRDCQFTCPSDDDQTPESTYCSKFGSHVKVTDPTPSSHVVMLQEGKGNVCADVQTHLTGARTHCWITLHHKIAAHSEKQKSQNGWRSQSRESHVRNSVSTSFDALQPQRIC